ncbi:hypothetical protein [Falsiroseomonas sp. CW058]|uniref:hypothetical protein n=1 Tax=Falsiroseomonas sp. CW058 TaxID=3388664 RepID=UPI003D31DF1B
MSDPVRDTTFYGYRPAEMIASDLLARARADAASALAKLRLENERLREGLRDLVDDDTRLACEMRDTAAAILAGTFRRAGK